MTLSKLNTAIDIALKMLNVNKLCYLAEDENAYYMTGCTDDGQGIYDGGVCRVEKKTMTAKRCHHSDPLLETPRKEINPPETRKDVFMKLAGFD